SPQHEYTSAGQTEGYLAGTPPAPAPWVPGNRCPSLAPLSNGAPGTRRCRRSLWAIEDYVCGVILYDAQVLIWRLRTAPRHPTRGDGDGSRTGQRAQLSAARSASCAADRLARTITAANLTTAGGALPGGRCGGCRRVMRGCGRAALLARSIGLP